MLQYNSSLCTCPAIGTLAWHYCENEVPDHRVKETLSFDYNPPGGLSLGLVKRIVVFQRFVLRSYRRHCALIRPAVDGFPRL